MALSDRERERYARHLLLAEIGFSGQERLSAAEVRLPDGADAGALAVATDYLARAGVRTGTHGNALHVPDGFAIEALAGSPELVEAARALTGALAAVEAVKAILELGSPLSGMPTSLSSEDV